jgi:hypothetical protein
MIWLNLPDLRKSWSIFGSANATIVAPFPAISDMGHCYERRISDCQATHATTSFQSTRELGYNLTFLFIISKF